MPMPMRDADEWIDSISILGPSRTPDCLLYIRRDRLASLIREAQEDGARAERERATKRMFPVMGDDRPGPGPTRIPWALVEPMRESCLRVHDQSLERLAERGGLSRGELHMHAHGLRWPSKDADAVRVWFDGWVASDLGARVVAAEAERDAAIAKAKKSEAEAALQQSRLAPFTAIAERLIGQDNLATAAPQWQVREDQRIYGIDPEHGGPVAWLDDESDEVTGEERDKLEAKWDETGDEPEGYHRTSYVDVPRVVATFVTRKAAERYREANAHNLRGGGKIFAASSYRNDEWHALLHALDALIGDQPDEAVKTLDTHKERADRAESELHRRKW